MSRSPALRPIREVNTEPAEPALIRLVSFLNAVLTPLTKRDWRDMDKIPKTGGVIFVVNHISNIDPLSFGQFVAYAGRWPRYLGKASLFRIPVVGKIITACGQIPVERNSRDARKALTQAIDAVNAGKSITVYPEGTITVDPQLWPMAGKTGAARIALATGCPVIPVGQWGAQDIMPGKKPSLPRFFPRKTLALKAGDPVALDDLRGQPPTPAVLRQATDRIMDAITALVADLRQQAAPPSRVDPSRRPDGEPGGETPV
ncbi:MAG TPA: lysophospholipid acyltransferase family protein [Propionibacteriaceae bacterium]|nr:lysophospholipid acyltransferase family protein [Propionibacteriaceae bacterium]